MRAKGGGGRKKKRRNKHEKLQTFQFICSWFGSHVHFFFNPPHYLNKMGAQEEEGGGRTVLITMQDCNNSLLLLLLTRFDPSPSRVPRRVGTAKLIRCIALRDSL